ncbi:hypothetical protein ASL11_22095 [Paenibacillus sp. Soil750]|nr:hypothetical protein ASL11_22095 [Paenibacillus sp. Soil750]
MNHLAELVYDVKERSVRLTASAEYTYHLLLADVTVRADAVSNVQTNNWPVSSLEAIQTDFEDFGLFCSVLVIGLRIDSK